MKGRVFNHYKIREKLGAGGMGQVYEACDTRLDRKVALKLLSSELVADRSALDRFEREARAASALNHPNICTIYDVGEHEDQPYIVMELLEGETLAERISGGELGTDEVLAIGIQVADALDAAHGAGIIHRDIKPENVIINSRGHAKVLDFGLATMSTSRTQADAAGSAPVTVLTERYALMGTAPYMSPEQARGEDVDARSDLFSLGAVLYEMGTGHRAFGGETAAATFEAILFRNPTDPVRLNPAFNGDLEAMILKALEKNPAERYQSSRDLTVDLRRLQRNVAFAAEAERRTPSSSSTLAMFPRARIRCVIVDDEEPARNLLREFLDPNPTIEIVAECANGFEAVKAVSELKPDLLLLDIQMPKLNGFEVLELIGDDVAVIFATAYDDYALKAFEVHAVDYLLKPFSRRRLEQALARVRKQIGGGRDPSISNLVEERRANRAPSERILVRDGSQVHVIAVRKIDYVEAQDDYVSFKTSERSYLKQETMNEIEAQLDPRRFVRIHRSYILNLDRLTRIELQSKDNRVAVLPDGTQLPVSRAGYARLKPLL